MSKSPMLSSEKCILMVVDIQEAFINHIPDLDHIVQRSCIMVQAAQLLEIPVIVTEQYPKGLGRTLKPLQDVLGDITYYDKVTFSSCLDKKVTQALLSYNRKQLLLIGLEAHVCVAQTTYDAIKQGLFPYIAVDAVGSRHDTDKQIAVERLRQSGAVITTTEAAILEMTATSKHPAFKKISQLIK
ncbi:MAG: hydrolase [Sedimentisphaerales bacterium]|nr:hydrolase [Sedimentisphaerales bacterium]